MTFSKSCLFFSSLLPDGATCRTRPIEEAVGNSVSSSSDEDELRWKFPWMVVWKWQQQQQQRRQQQQQQKSVDSADDICFLRDAVTCLSVPCMRQWLTPCFIPFAYSLKRQKLKHPITPFVMSQRAKATQLFILFQPRGSYCGATLKSSHCYDNKSCHREELCVNYICIT